MEPLKQVKGGVLLEVKVKTNCSQTNLHRKDETFILELENQPQDNKANIEALKYLKKRFGCEVSLIRGQKSKNKTFLINCSIQDVNTLND